MIHYLAELWYLLGAGLAKAFDFAALSIILVSGCSMFLLCRLLFGTSGGLLGAAAYLYGPYMHVDLYVRRALAEFSAFAFYPLILYAFAKFSIQRDKRFLLLGAAAFGALILCHNASALLFSPLLMLFFCYQAWQRRSWQMFWLQIVGMMLGLAMSSFFWIPSLWNMKYVHIERASEWFYDYSNHFVSPDQLVARFWGYGGSGPNRENGMSFSLGWSHLLLAFFAITARHRIPVEARRMQWFLVVAILVACVFMTSSSSWIWAHAPLLRFVQFPWRLLAPATFCLAILVGSLGPVFKNGAFRTPIPAVVGILLLVVPNWDHPKPEAHIEVHPDDWTPQRIAEGGVETTVSREYEPRSIQLWPRFDEKRFLVISGDANVLAPRFSPTAWSATATCHTRSVIEARLSYFVGWLCLRMTGQCRLRSLPKQAAFDSNSRLETTGWT
jgi:6-pyruvoyl-tetrahydropterin synthase related domain